MLKESVISSVVPLAENLASKGRFLRAVPGSWVGQCVDAMRNVELTLHDVAPITLDNDGVPRQWTLWDYQSAIKEASTQADLAGVRTHCSVMEARSIQLAEHANAMISHARNVAKPMIEDVESRLQALIAASVTGVLNPLTVVAEKREAFWYSPIFSLLVDDYSELEIRELDLKKIFPHIEITNNEEALAVLAVSSDTINAELKDFVESVGFAAIGKVYNGIFSATANEWLPDYELSVHSGSSQSLLIAFLILHHFVNASELPVVEGYTDDTLHAYLSSAKAELGRRLSSYTKLRDSYTSGGKLVLRYPNATINEMLNGATDNIIVVNPDLYESWLEQGGTPEVIFGAFIGDREVTASVLLEHAKSFSDAWESISKFLADKAKTNYENTVRTNLEVVVAQVIYELPEDQVTIPKEVMHTKLAEEMSLIGSVQFFGSIDLYRLVRRVVCRTLFAHLEDERVLTELDNQAEANPGIEPREAATLALIDLLAHWAVEQFTVETV